MEEFPFTDEEWRSISRATTSVTNATLADDDVWRAIALRRLRRRLRALRLRYGNHPVLIETLADFLDDSDRRRLLYRRAIRIASRNNLPTWTIRFSYARLLLEKFADRRRALRQLRLCEHDIASSGDDYYLGEWRELMRQVRR